jgi:Ca2+-binding RTX toxin-like protein
VTDLGNVEDGLWHQVHVVSDGQTISYTVDGVAISTLSLATAETYLGSQYAYFGFTGATGGLTELEQVRVTALDATAENGTALLIGATGQEPAFTANGDAVNTAADVYTVTPNAELQHGSVMSDVRVDLGETFDLTFQINVGADDNGADGMGFVLHNDPLGHNALGGLGGAMGMVGITNGIGIEFDTFDSADDPNDIANDHTAFDNLAGGSLTAVQDLGNIEDGLWHEVHVVSDGQTISYTFDGVAMSSLSLAVAETYLGSQYAYFGFTGATGGLTEQEQVRLVGLDATAEDGAHLQIGGTGGTGVNTVLGTPGNDVLTGTAANDLISGLAGNDTLTGGLGNDTFVFAPGFGNDTITDWTRAVGNRDIIDLTAFGFASGTEALSHAYANGADTVFDFGNGDLLTVHNTAAGYVTNLLVDDLMI